MRVEIRIKIRSQPECDDCQQHPRESILSQADEKGEQRQKKRRKHEKAIEAHAAYPTRGIGCQAVSAGAVSFRLRVVIKLLLASPEADAELEAAAP